MDAAKPKRPDDRADRTSRGADFERERMERALRDSEALYESLVESLSQNIFRKDQYGRFTYVNRAAEQLAARFNSDRIALAITSALNGHDLIALRQKLQDTRSCVASALAAFDVSCIPSRQELIAEAKVMFARTPSLDDIVNRAYDLILASIGMELLAEQPSSSP